VRLADWTDYPSTVTFTGFETLSPLAFTNTATSV